jgi:hypothetical protein
MRSPLASKGERRIGMDLQAREVFSDQKPKRVRKLLDGAASAQLPAIHSKGPPPIEPEVFQ